MKTSTRQIVPEEENLIKKLFAKYLPYWPLLLFAIIAGVLAAYTYIKFTTPKYKATATLIIKDEKKGNEESKLMESLNQISSKKIVENEIEVIQSRKLMKDVATKLNLFTPITEKGSMTDGYSLAVPPVFVLADNPDALVTSTKKIPIKYSPEKSQVALDNIYWFPMNRAVETPYGKLRFELNRAFKPVGKTPEYFLSVISPNDLVPAMLSNLKAEPASKSSSIVNLSYIDTNPRRAEEVLNQLINSYRQSEVDEKDALAKNTLEFVNERLQLVTHELDSIQQKVQQYKSSAGAVDISTQGQLYLQNVSQNDQKLSEINTQISVLNQVENFVKSGTNQGSIVPSTLGISDPLLSQLLEKLNTLELEYEKGKATIGENNPKLLAVKDQINKIKPDILRNIGSQQKSLYAMRGNVSSTNSSYNSILRGVPEKEKELIDISRAEQNKRDIYYYLLQKKEESEIAYASTVSNNKVVDYAKAENHPVSPKKLIVLFVSVMALLAIALLFINIRESMTGKIVYRSEIESSTKVPVIAEVAYQKLDDPIVIQYGQRSFIAEQFRKLRLSLSFLGVGTKHKKILVTSSISGEGKSFIAANLAVSLTLMGKKVVLVDMDLNNPRQQEIFKTAQTKGVTEYLQGKAEVKDILGKISRYENLYLINSGELPDDPAELLSSDRTKELINNLEKSFDIIVIDTSPMALVTDGYMVTDLCDITLFVVRHTYTPKMLIKRLDENIDINPIHNPVIVFNGVKQRGVLANVYGYGYGYDYVYGKNNIYGKKKGKIKISS